MNTLNQSEPCEGVILLMGGPGAGKGTQASLLSSVLGIPRISSSDLLRGHKSDAMETLMEGGDLLPDRFVTDVVLERLRQPDAERGVVLDGFPRTLAQAQELDTWIQQQGRALRSAVYLDVPTDQLFQRVIARGVVSGRPDDREQAAHRRLAVFLREFPPLLRYYAERGVLGTVDATRPIDHVHQQVVQFLGKPA